MLGAEIRFEEHKTKFIKNMAFTGNEDHSISLLDAAELTKNYRDAGINGVKAEFFGKTTLEGILDQQNCVGLRIYFGLKLGELGEPDKLCLVITGAKANEDDIIDEDYLAEFGLPCPSRCGTSNVLNSD
jgi:hypothetical protein